jgi:hypothetical protein
MFQQQPSFVIDEAYSIDHPMRRYSLGHSKHHPKEPIHMSNVHLRNALAQVVNQRSEIALHLSVEVVIKMLLLHETFKHSSPTLLSYP